MTEDPGLGSQPFCYLTTTGRVTGRSHRIEIWFALHDEVVYVLSGGREHADWVRNILVSPQVVLEIGDVKRLTQARVVQAGTDEDGLARRLLGRQPANLGTLAYRFVTDARPCHRALPDAEATAEILLRLIGMAQERGARSVADLVELAATRPRRIHRKRNLAFGAPQRPGVYLFREVLLQIAGLPKDRL